MAKKETLYKVVFHNQGQVYEIYARNVGQGGLFGFVEISELVFGASTTMVIDPSEDRLRQEFDGVERLHVPMHSMIRIDEVRKEGTGRILEPEQGDAKVSPFPVPVYAPSGSDGGKKS